ncbi:MAG: hypothetical protein O2985_14350, partial [Proteobacteria bacterium]|nr:hypothetical protein [Pseudomonadota bacterium]
MALQVANFCAANWLVFAPPLTPFGHSLALHWRAAALRDNRQPHSLTFLAGYPIELEANSQFTPRHIMARYCFSRLY